MLLALLVFTLFLAGLTLLHLLQLTGEVLFAHQSARIVVLHLLAELLQLFTNQSGLFLLGLCLFDFSDSVFYLTVRLGQQFFSLRFGTVQNGLALAFYLFQTGIQLLASRLQTLLVLVNGLTLAFPIALVAHDVLQVLVTLDIVRPDNLRCIIDNFLRDTGFAGYLYGKARTRLTNRQLEQRLHLMAVVEHGSVHHTGMVFGKVLQILIVGGDDAEGLLLPELLQHGFGNGAADGRLCTAAKLIDQQQRMAVGLLHHVLHVQQVTRIGRQIVGYRLLVTDVYHDVAEYTTCRTVTNGNRQSALQHILQQSHRLQTHRLTTSIRTGDNKETANILISLSPCLLVSF